MPLDEPSVPVQNVHLDSLNLGQQQCLISEEVIVSAGPSTETATSQFLSLPTGDGLDKLVLSLLTRITDLQSARGPQPPVQSQSITNEISQQGVILPNVCQPSVQSQSAGSRISQQGVILPNVCQPSVSQRGVELVSRALFCLMSVSLQLRPGVKLVNRELFCLMSVNPFLLIQRWRGSPPPLHCFLTRFNRFSGSPQRPYLATPFRGLSPTIRGSSFCRKHSLPLSRRLIHFAIAAFVHINPFWTLPNRLPGTCRMLGYRQHGLVFRRLRSLRRPKWVLLVQRRPKWVLLVQRRPKGVLLAQSSSLLSLVRQSSDLETRLSVSRTTHLARGVVPHPARGVGSLAIRLKRTTRLKVANNGTTNRTKRIIFVLPHWNFF